MDNQEKMSTYTNVYVGYTRRRSTKQNKSI